MFLIFFVLRSELLGPQPLPGLDELGESARLARLSRRITTIDAGGQLLFLFGFGFIILALTWGGVTYEWNTAAVLAPLCFGVGLVSLFVCYESLMAPGRALASKWPSQKSMVPWKLLVTKDVGLLFYINFATGAAMYSVSLSSAHAVCGDRVRLTWEGAGGRGDVKVLYFCNLYFTMVKV